MNDIGLDFFMLVNMNFYMHRCLDIPYVLNEMFFFYARYYYFLHGQKEIYIGGKIYIYKYIFISYFFSAPLFCESFADVVKSSHDSIKSHLPFL